MNIGDLVVYKNDDPDEDNFLGLGIVTSFDKDDDPVVWFQCDPVGQKDGGSAFYMDNIVVISEHR